MKRLGSDGNIGPGGAGRSGFGEDMQMFAIVRKGDGHRLGPAMDDDSTRVFLVWPTLKEAEIGFDFQMKNYLQGEEGDWFIASIDGMTEDEKS